MLFLKGQIRGQTSVLYMKMLIAEHLAACKCQVLIGCLENYFQALLLTSGLQVF